VPRLGKVPLDTTGGVCFPSVVVVPIKRSVRTLAKPSEVSAVGGQARNKSNETGAPSMSCPCARQTLDPLKRSWR
jgi:hypothetical protein